MCLIAHNRYLNVHKSNFSRTRFTFCTCPFENVTYLLSNRGPHFCGTLYIRAGFLVAVFGVMGIYFGAFCFAILNCAGWFHKRCELGRCPRTWFWWERVFFLLEEWDGTGLYKELRLADLKPNFTSIVSHFLAFGPPGFPYSSSSSLFPSRLLRAFRFSKRPLGCS